MKKILISMMLVAGIATAYAADVTTRAKITLGSSAITVRESADLSDAEDSGYDAVVYGSTNIAVIANSKKWAEWGTNDLEGVVIEFTPAAENVSFAFSNVKGDLYLVDKQDNSRTKIVAGATYDFTVEASQVGVAQANRFAISKIAGPEICFNYNKLTVKGYAGKTLKVMKGADVVVAEKTLSDNEEFDLSAQSGRLVVTLDGKEYQIDANPAVTEVKP